MIRGYYPDIKAIVGNGWVERQIAREEARRNRRLATQEAARRTAETKDRERRENASISLQNEAMAARRRFLSISHGCALGGSR